MRDELFLLPVGCGFYPEAWWFWIPDAPQSRPGVVMDGHVVYWWEVIPSKSVTTSARRDTQSRLTGRGLGASYLGLMCL